MGENLTNIFLQLFCEKNSDGTRTLCLRGKDIWQRIGERINDYNMFEISDFLTENSAVVKLDLCYNDITGRGLQIFVNSYLKQENNLQHLDLTGCNLGPQAVKFLYGAGATNRLKTLRLTGNKLGSKSGPFLSELLKRNDTIEHLDLGDTDQTLTSLPYIISVLQDPECTTKLKVLDISRVVPDCKHYQYDPGHLAEQFGNMLKVNQVLREVHLQKCEFDGHDVELLLIGLSFNKTLLLLDLGYNRIGDHGIELLANWLRSRPCLLGLNVAGNEIGDTGARALSFNLPFSRLRLLDLSKNKVSDIGMEDILNSIKKPYVLRLFYFWGNPIGQITFKILKMMLACGILKQEGIDVKLYKVDGVLQHAFYPCDHYKHKYYRVMDHGCPIELRIRRNMVEHERAQPRALVNFKFYPRVPPCDHSLPLFEKPC